MYVKHNVLNRRFSLNLPTWVLLGRSWSTLGRSWGALPKSSKNQNRFQKRPIWAPKKGATMASTWNPNRTKIDDQYRCVNGFQTGFQTGFRKNRSNFCEYIRIYSNIYSNIFKSIQIYSICFKYIRIIRRCCFLVFLTNFERNHFKQKEKTDSTRQTV